MGRHSSGKRNLRISGWLITLVCVIALLAAAIYGWTLLRARNAADDAAYRADCFEGTLALPIYETSPGLAGVSLRSWHDTHPVVRDHCIEPHIVSDPADAALIIALSDKDLDAALTRSERSVAGAPTPTRLTLGVGVREGSDSLASSEAESTSFPEGKAAAPALALTKGDVDHAEELLRRDRMVTPEKAASQRSPAIASSVLPDSYQWVSVKASTGALVAPLTVSDRVEEEQTRAASALADYLNDPSLSRDVPEIDRAALDDLLKRLSRLPAEDTLFLLDASERMRDSFGEKNAFDATRDALLDASRQLEEQQHSVALMTYSNSRGLDRPEGFRLAAGFGPASTIEEALKDKGPREGAPQSRAAVKAALDEQEKHRRETGAQTRLIVLTTGHDDMEEDGGYRDLIASARREGVDLHFIQVGYSPMDPVISDDHPTMAYDEPQLREAVGRLSGTWI